MKLLSLEPESSASANSATSAYLICFRAAAPRDTACNIVALLTLFAILLVPTPSQTRFFSHRERSFSKLPIPPHLHLHEYYYTIIFKKVNNIFTDFYKNQGAIARTPISISINSLPPYSSWLSYALSSYVNICSA